MEKCGERRNGGPTIRFLFASATGFANVGIRICRAYQACLTLQRIRSRARARVISDVTNLINQDGIELIPASFPPLFLSLSLSAFSFISY